MESAPVGLISIPDTLDGGLLKPPFFYAEWQVMPSGPIGLARERQLLSVFQALNGNFQDKQPVCPVIYFDL